MSWPGIDWVQVQAHLRGGVRQRDGAHHPLTWRRSTALLVTAVLFAYGMLQTRLFWALDALLFPGWKRVEPDRPIFVVGNFRSGTTMFMKMLRHGVPRATSLSTWEIYMGTTVSQRLCMRGIAIVDRLFGAPLERVVRRFNALLAQVPYHPIDLFGPEEDAGTLMFVWSGFFTWFLFPRSDRIPEVAMLDRMRPHRRRQVIGFYRDVVRKHLYARRRHRPSAPPPTFISKNPAFTGAVNSLRAYFPDARIVTVVRDYEATVRSSTKWFRVWFRVLGARETREPSVELVRRLVTLWHEYPQRMNVAHVDYCQLIERPREELQRIGRLLDIPRFAQGEKTESAVVELDYDHGSGGAQPPLPLRARHEEDSRGSIHPVS